MQRGYVKIWRKLEDSGLIQLPNTLALFMHLLLNATHKDRKVGTPNGVVHLKRGQFLSGRIELAARLRQSEQEIRTSLKRLENLEIISIESTNRFSIYTIENYNKYQDEQPTDNQQNSQPNNQQITIEQPTDNQQSTTKQTHKNLNIKEIKTPLALLVGRGIPDELAKSWLAIRKVKRLALTEPAIDMAEREGAKIGMNLQQVITVCCENSWAGFKAEYMKQLEASGSGREKPWYLVFSRIEEMGKKKGIVQGRDETHPQLKDRVYAAYGITQQMVRQAVQDFGG